MQKSQKSGQVENQVLMARWASMLHTTFTNEPLLMNRIKISNTIINKTTWQIQNTSVNTIHWGGAEGNRDWLLS